MRNRITVPQVAHAMGVELSNKVAWSVGSEIASLYFKQFGEQPPKDNRPKTNGQGSHCFALYPPSWEVIIKKAIEGHVESAKNQGNLFSD
jgi:hypothetical protein